MSEQSAPEGKELASSEAKNKGGRPSGLTQEIADEICERLADGESLRSICEEEGKPSKSMVMRWLRQAEWFRDQYTRAREMQADVLADEILNIADDGRNDWMERNADGSKGWAENGEALRRSQIRIDARKWMAGKMRPKVYGDKITQEQSGPDGGPVQHVHEIRRSVVKPRS